MSIFTSTILAAKSVGPFGLPRKIFTPNLWKPGSIGYGAAFVPLGYVHLFDALDQWGAYSFGESWTGYEVAARELAAVMHPGLAGGVEHLDDQPQSGGIRVPFLAPYRAVTPRGWSYFQTEAEASKAFEAERPALVEMFEQEQLARVRFRLSAHSLRRFLYAGHFSAAVINTRTGNLYPVPPVFWGSDTAVPIFELRDNPTDDNQDATPRIKNVPAIVGPNQMTMSGYVLVSEAELSSFLKPNAATPTSSDPVVSEISDAVAKPKSKGGRPQKYDVDALIREIVGRANSLDGLPETRAELQRQLASWCLDQWGEEPGDSTMRDYLRRWVPDDLLKT